MSSGTTNRYQVPIWRVVIVYGVMFAFIGAILFRLVNLQVITGETWTGQAIDNYTLTISDPAPRGIIYDRNGYILARNVASYNVVITPAELPDDDADVQRIYREISTLTGVPAGGPVTSETLDFAKLFSACVPGPTIADMVALGASLAPYNPVKITCNISEQLARIIGEKSVDWPGVSIEIEAVRDYPTGSLTANVVGFLGPIPAAFQDVYEERGFVINRDKVGYSGVEASLDDILIGKNGQRVVQRDVAGAVLRNLEPPVPSSPGNNVVLTIDSRLQKAAETALLDEINIWNTFFGNLRISSGVVIAMNPKTGEILAMAATPRMDLNNYTDYFQIYDNGSQYNRSIGMAYEAGSVVKVLTMAAALDTGAVTPATTYIDTGSITVGGITIRNWDRQPWGQRDMTECLQHSLNVCLAWVATQMGSPTFYSYMDKFGLGHRTGVDLADEAMGRLKVPGDSDWYPVDLGTNAFGQGVTVTPLQMMMAASAIANKGQMVTPHVLYAMIRDGHQYNVPSQYAGAPIKAETARTLNEMLAASLQSESASALLPGYRLAGKTGTAQIPTEYGYDANHTNVSFIGWGPVDDPQFMIYVWLQEPTTSIWSSQTAAPVFSTVAEQTVITLNIPPDLVRNQYGSR